MRPVAVYSALRVGIFLGSLLLLRLLGVSGLIAVVVAVLLSLLLSFVVLRRQRDAVTRAMMARNRQRRGGRSGAAEPPATATPPATEAPAPASAPRRRWRDRFAEDAAFEDAATGPTSPRPPASRPATPAPVTPSPSTRARRSGPEDEEDA